MNKSDLVQGLSAKAGLSRNDATKVIEALFSPEDGLVIAALRRGDKVQITGFGQEIRIDSTVSPSFRPGKALKDAVKSLMP
jgi:DNA-binding protein HU-beta